MNIGKLLVGLLGITELMQRQVLAQPQRENQFLRGLSNPIDPQFDEDLYDESYFEQPASLQAKANNKAHSNRVYTKIPIFEAREITSMVNNARARINKFQPAAAKMYRVTYNLALQHDLENVVAHVDPQWFFQANQTGSRYNLENLTAFEPLKTKYGSKIAFLVHDGCQSIRTALRRNFFDRTIMQANCFNYANCSPYLLPEAGSINGYKSCEKQPILAVSHQHCSWAWQYYPMFLNDNMQDFGCALTGHPGPNAAGFRPNHFFCYYSKIDPTKPKTSEIPYAAGPACSACPKDMLCVDHLCTPKPKI